MTKRKPGRPSLSVQQKDEIRECIINIARELFVNEGYENTSMRRIAAQAGFAPTKIYYYFENKKEILKHFWADISIDMWQQCKPSNKILSSEPIEVIQHLMQANVNYWLENPKNYQLLIETQDFKAPLDNNFDIYNSPGTKEYVETMIDAITRCMASGTFKEGNVLYVSQLITIATYGVFGCFYNMPSVAWDDKQHLITDSIENTLRGLSSWDASR
ncbi:MAG: TetR/AcrR family transcriptional regulator [Kangiellaceae bacterium]|nr:TetR/AcrR family transcriptional regulator [Kangiellaceae bacterium]